MLAVLVIGCPVDFGEYQLKGKELSGTVTSGGSPLAGVTVTISMDHTTAGSAITDSNGAYTIANVPTGTGYTITASKAWYITGTITGFTIPSTGDPPAADFTLSTSVTFLLNEDFDTLSAWSSTGQGTNTIEIVSDPDDETNKLLQIHRVAASAVGIWNTVNANASGVFTVETRIKRSVSTYVDNSGNNANQYQIYTYESSKFADVSAGANSSANIVFDSGFIKTFLNASVAGTTTTGNTNVVLRRYAANDWYKIVMRIDTAADTFDFYVDGVKHARDALRTAVDTIGTFSIAGTSGSDIGYLWVDYLMIYQGEPQFPDDDGTNDNGEPIPVVPSDDPAVVAASRSSDWWQNQHTTLKNTLTTGQKILFIGDSITDYWDVKGDGGGAQGEGNAAWGQLNTAYNNKITNLGFSGDETQNVIWRLQNGEFPTGLDAEYAVLLIGTNNRHGPISTAAGIGEIIKTIHENGPSTKIILLAIFPRGTGNDDPNRLRNEAVNGIIKNYDGYFGTQYVDLGQYFVNADGSLKSDLFRDKLHLTAAGYEVWKEKLLEIITP
jgi:lysophospholipase L1-like esterase